MKDINMERLAALRGAMSPPPEEAPPPEPTAAVAAPDAAAAAAAPAAAPAPAPAPAPGVAPPPPGEPPVDTTVLPAGAGDAATDAALAPVPDDDEALSPVVDEIMGKIAAADSPEAAAAIMRDFLKEQSKAVREAAMAELPKIAENMQAAAREWEEAAEGMFSEHPGLRSYGDLLEMLTKDEYGKDPKRKPKDIYAAVAERANGMLRLQTGSPSLPEATGGGLTPPDIPADEDINTKRLRELRAARGGK